MHRARGSPEFSQISIDGPIYGAAGAGVVSGSVQVGTLFAPTLGLHFQALLPHSFLFICTLHWYKHCTRLELAPNKCIFQMMALYGAAENRVVCGPVQVGTLFAPTQGLHFQALLPHSFLFMCTLHWCKNTQLVPELSQISIDNRIWRCMRRSSLEARAGRCVFCTDTGFTIFTLSYPIASDSGSSSRRREIFPFKVTGYSSPIPFNCACARATLHGL